MDAAAEHGVGSAGAVGGEQTQQSEQAYDPSKDPKRKAKSKDPGWKYAFWPDLTNKDLVQCILCGKQMHSGIKRLKQHLAAGFGDVQRCPKSTTLIMREMQEYMKKTARNKMINLDDDEEEGEDVQEVQINQEASSKASCGSTHPNSGTAAKRKQTQAGLMFKPAVKMNKSVVSMIRKTPEEVVEERHSKQPAQTFIEQHVRTKEEKERVDMHVANFFYQCGIPFNAAFSRSFEIMVESIGQYGHGYKAPSYHELRLPLLAKAKNKIKELREKQELVWREYGCSLMSDGWTDKRGRHLINFLVNCPEGTFFLESIDASFESANARMLADVLEKMINCDDLSLHTKISDQADDYEKIRKSFAKQSVVMQRKTKSPLDWWDAFGGLTREASKVRKTRPRPLLFGLRL